LAVGFTFNAWKSKTRSWTTGDVLGAPGCTYQCGKEESEVACPKFEEEGDDRPNADDEEEKCVLDGGGGEVEEEVAVE